MPCRLSVFIPCRWYHASRESKSSVCFTIPFVPCRLSVFIPSRWYHASRGQRWSPRASMAHFFPSTFSQSVVYVSLNPRTSTIPSVPCRLSVFIPCRWYHASRESKSSVCFTIPFVPCRLSVFIPSRWYHASRGQTWSPRASMAHFFPSTFSQSVVYVSLNPRTSTIPSVSCRFSVFIPCRWYHASRGQTWNPRASMAQSLPCLFSQSLLCVSLKPRVSTIPSVPCRLSVFIPSRWYHASRESKSSVCFTIPFVPCRLSVFIPSRWYHASRGQTWSPRASMAHFFPSTFSQSVVYVSLNPRTSTIPSVSCRFSVFIPSRWYHASRGQTWNPRASMAQSLPCLFSQSLLCVSLKPRASTIPSVPCRLSVFIPCRWYHASRESKSSVCFTIPFVPCRLSVFIPSRWYHASRGQRWSPRASMAHFFPSTFSQSVVYVSLNPRTSTIPSVPCRLSVFIPCRWYHASRESKSSVCFTIPFVPCRLSVFIPSRWYHASRGQTWSPRASMAHFFPSTFSQSVVYVSLNPRTSTIPSVSCRLSVFIPCRWYHASRGQTWNPRASMAQSLPCLFSQSLLCVSRSHLCHVGSVCSSHLGGTTHLVDKRGALEQA